MLRIRLRRVGKRGRPSYRIVVADVRAPRDGAYLEWIGNYDPMADPPAVTIKKDRAEEWLSKGAQPSDAVKRILQWQEIIERDPVNQSPQRKEAAPEPATLVQTAPAATAVAEDLSEDSAPEDSAPEDSAPEDSADESAPAADDDSSGGGDASGEAPE